MKSNYKNTIDYILIGEALKFYQSRNYEYIEVPWFVEHNISNITRPVECHDIVISDGREEYSFIASAEQSFLQLAKENKLYYGKKYCAITPCFRDEKEITEISRSYFMKLELFYFDKNIIQFNHLSLMEDFKEFAKIKGLSVKEKQTDVGFDIESESGIELGSYGMRRYDHLTWSYGTGIAEPRFNMSLKNEI